VIINSYDINIDNKSILI